MLNPMTALQDTTDYLLDAWQRSLLYADIMRERGNQYQAHKRETIPNVLDFPAEIVLRGDALERPVNYGLVRIRPPADMPCDERKRPFIIIDPRAGHGPGIGGFKADSEIGVVLAAGHPCYFIGFTPQPMPGQSVEDVMRAEAAFVRAVAERHPQAQGRPAVIGNCQAGWQILMAAAVWPELFGPIIVAGTPLSYWAGWRGRDPMRYMGGLTGGSWLTALASDLGGGHFDGAWLVQNFEKLNPANTWWGKNHHLYAEVDTEGPRYLKFEKYWGGYVCLNDIEMQTIVDDLFIGNKLASAELVTSDGVRIDLRNIRSPIVVFCSHGDNITPPPQALGWITDLYRDTDDVRAHDQTIAYATHDSIGHLGIFVSSAVGRKEHAKFANNIELIDSLPAGLFELSVADKKPGESHDDLVQGQYRMTVHQRTVADVRAIVAPDPVGAAASDRRFAAAAHVSQINLALYRRLMQPWIRSLITPQAASLLRSSHPLRIRYELWSDAHPLAGPIQQLAGNARAQRAPVHQDNPWWRWQEATSDAIMAALDGWRDQRDRWYEWFFETGYDQPLVQALAGQADRHAPARRHPGNSPEHQALMRKKQADAKAALIQGGLDAATIRALYHVLHCRREIDERQYQLALRLFHSRQSVPPSSAHYRALARTQALLMQVAPDQAMASLPRLLAGEPAADILQAMRHLEAILNAGGPLQGPALERWQHIRKLFEDAAQKPAPNPPLLADNTDSARHGRHRSGPKTHD
ncbi:DUF3141 domain-containing protein [Castellaniella sp.]|uniref:DUF3141 domain-containing protein n=1 Tax=Castellaniella sp. TaxID=1955812 RepID=UPI00356983F5